MAEGTSSNLSTGRQDAIWAVRGGKSPGFLSWNPGVFRHSGAVTFELGKILMGGCMQEGKGTLCREHGMIKGGEAGK